MIDLEQLEALKGRVQERAAEFIRAIDLVKELVQVEPGAIQSSKLQDPKSKEVPSTKPKIRKVKGESRISKRASSPRPSPPSDGGEGVGRRRVRQGSSRELVRMLMAKLGQFTTKQLNEEFAKRHPDVKVSTGFISCSVVQIRQSGEVTLVRAREGRGDTEGSPALYQWIGENQKAESGKRKAASLNSSPPSKSKPSQREMAYQELRGGMKLPGAEAAEGE